MLKNRFERETRRYATAEREYLHIGEQKNEDEYKEQNKEYEQSDK